MFQWTCEERQQTTASPEAIWQLWSNCDSWPLWDAGVAWAKVETIFTQGNYISMKPVGGPAVRCLLSEVTPNRSFTTRSRLPLTTVSFSHHMADGTICHTVAMHGLLVPLFKRLFGRNIQKGLPDVVRTLVAMAENSATNQNQG